MDLRTVLRSRIAAAAVGASVLGFTAALVPTVSNAADDAVSPATSVVTWADDSADFTPIDTEADTPAIPAGWSWFGLQQGEDGYATSLDQVASFGDDGITAKDGAAVLLVHPLRSTVAPDALTGLIDDAAANAGGDTEVGLLVAKASSPTLVEETVYTTGGLQGTDTVWAGGESTDELAAQLQTDGDVVFGYAVVLNGATATPPATGETTPAPTETPAPSETTAPTSTPAARSAAPEQGVEKLLPQASTANTFAARAAVPADSGIADLVIDDSTTYFTPQPTASIEVSDLLLSQSSTGFQVVGTGYAPEEAVAAIVTQGDDVYTIPTNASIADQNGNVVVVVTLPAGTVEAGSYSVTLTGRSSGQTASGSAAFLADPAVAPVATPVSGRATFTG